jgi:quinol monooxygenase YgiN
MFAGVLKLRLQEDMHEACLEIWKKALPEVRKAKGFKYGWCMLGELGDVLSVGIWETKEDADAFIETDAFHRFIDEVRDMLDGPPERRVYRVAATDPPNLLKMASPEM